jgi:16S rRNA (cytidine1402-2'-O)-methyltransferase
MKKLILLPNTLHEESAWSYTPPAIDALIAESDKGGYQFLKKFGLPKCPIYLLNEHTQKPEDLIKIQEAVVGLISDAGLPCLADPGSAVVAAAHRAGIAVEAVPGPNSIMMALQLSGFSGQAFTFHGYFPREEQHLSSLLKKLDPHYTHLFIETPYKTEKLFQLLIKYLPAHAGLSISLELMGSHSYTRTDSIEGWKKKPLPVSKARAVFVISFKVNNRLNGKCK